MLIVSQFDKRDSIFTFIIDARKSLEELGSHKLISF